MDVSDHFKAKQTRAERVSRQLQSFLITRVCECVCGYAHRLLFGSMLKLGNPFSELCFQTPTMKHGILLRKPSTNKKQPSGICASRSILEMTSHSCRSSKHHGVRGVRRRRDANLVRHTCPLLHTAAGVWGPRVRAPELASGGSGQAHTCDRWENKVRSTKPLAPRGVSPAGSAPR